MVLPQVKKLPQLPAFVAVMPLVLSRAESRNYPGLWGPLKGRRETAPFLNNNFQGFLPSRTEGNIEEEELMWSKTFSHYGWTNVMQLTFSEVRVCSSFGSTVRAKVILVGGGCASGLKKWSRPKLPKWSDFWVQFWFGRNSDDKKSTSRAWLRHFGHSNLCSIRISPGN